MKTFLAATFVLGLMLSATVDYAEANGAAVGAAAQRPYSLQQPFHSSACANGFAAHACYAPADAAPGALEAISPGQAGAGSPKRYTDSHIV